MFFCLPLHVFVIFLPLILTHPLSTEDILFIPGCTLSDELAWRESILVRHGLHISHLTTPITHFPFTAPPFLMSRLELVVLIFFLAIERDAEVQMWNR